MIQNYKNYFRRVVKKIVGDLLTVKWAIIIIIAYFAILKNYLYSLCPSVIITGYPCPACGLTRAGFSVLQGNFALAAQINVFIYPVMLFILIFCVNRYLLLRETPQWMYWLLAGIIIWMIIYYIYRMKRYFPDTPPMTYYYDNLLERLKHR